MESVELMVGISLYMRAKLLCRLSPCQMFHRNGYQDALKVFNPEAGRLPNDQMREVITKAFEARHKSEEAEKKSQVDEKTNKTAENDEVIETEVADDEPKVQEISDDEVPLVPKGDGVEEKQDCKKLEKINSEVEGSLERLKMPLTWDGVKNLEILEIYIFFADR